MILFLPLNFNGNVIDSYTEQEENLFDFGQSKGCTAFRCDERY